eukprot:11526-Heterococcus_DN1.PRE.2
MAVQASETSVMITDSSETVVWANCALAKLAGVDSAADIIGRSVRDIFLWTKDVNSSCTSRALATATAVAGAIVAAVAVAVAIAA